MAPLDGPGHDMTDSVTVGLMVSLYGWAMARKPKNFNGSPGWARTADLAGWVYSGTRQGAG